MTKRKHLKQRVRARAAKTGESYTAALRHLRPSEEVTPVDLTEPIAPTLDCSFCKKSSEQVEKLVAGPGVYICDECIGLAAAIVETEQQRPRADDDPRSLDDHPVDALLDLFGGMAATKRSTARSMQVWATVLEQRGVSRTQLAAAAGLTEDELDNQLSM